LAIKYNKNRGKESGIKTKLRVLKKGDKVRINIIGDKKTSFYKSYKGETWSKKTYVVMSKKGRSYKVDGPDGKKMYHRDNLRLTEKYDEESEKILKQRGEKMKVIRKKQKEKLDAKKIQERIQKKKIVKDIKLKKKIPKKN